MNIYPMAMKMSRGRSHVSMTRSSPLHLNDEVENTSLGSHVPLEVDVTPCQKTTQGSSNASFVMSNRKKRGPNKSTKFNQLFKDGRPVEITIPPKARGPVGKNANHFSRRVTHVVREHAELWHSSWTRVPPSERQRLKARVLAEWTLDENLANHIESIELALSNSYKSLRHGFHCHFLKFGGDKDSTIAKTKVLELISQPIWLKICESFENKGWKDKSARNKKNRSELKTNHTSGSRSFLNHRHSEMGEDEEEPSLIDFYKISHLKKDMSFVTTQCEERYNLMLEKLADKEGVVDEEEIFTQALGGKRSGHVRGMGKFVIPTPSSSSRSL